MNKKKEEVDWRIKLIKIANSNKKIKSKTNKALKKFRSVKETCIACGKERVIFSENVCKKCHSDFNREVNIIKV